MLFIKNELKVKLEDREITTVDYYEGEFVNCVPYGIGIIKFRNGLKIELEDEMSTPWTESFNNHQVNRERKQNWPIF